MYYVVVVDEFYNETVTPFLERDSAIRFFNERVDGAQLGFLSKFRKLEIKNDGTVLFDYEV